LTQNGRKSQEGFEEIFGSAKTMAAAIASCSFSLRETHFRWKPHIFQENLRDKSQMVTSEFLLRSIGEAKAPKDSFFKSAEFCERFLLWAKNSSGEGVLSLVRFFIQVKK